MADFLSLLDIDNIKVPERFQRFLAHDTAPAYLTRKWDYYAVGYACAFDALVAYATEREPGAEYLRLPLFYLCRHSVELHLKSLILELEGSDETAWTEEHSLDKLWKRLIASLASAHMPVDDDFSRECGKIINHMHEFDRDGSAFRYPCTREGRDFPYTRVEIEKLKNNYRMIKAFCAGTSYYFHESSPY